MGIRNRLQLSNFLQLRQNIMEKVEKILLVAQGASETRLNICCKINEREHIAKFKSNTYISADIWWPHT